jgi:hypothetical protein
LKTGIDFMNLHFGRKLFEQFLSSNLGLQKRYM